MFGSRSILPRPWPWDFRLLASPRTSFGRRHSPWPQSNWCWLFLSKHPKVWSCYFWDFEILRAWHPREDLPISPRWNLYHDAIGTPKHSFGTKLMRCAMSGQPKTSRAFRGLATCARAGRSVGKATTIHKKGSSPKAARCPSQTGDWLTVFFTKAVLLLGIGSLFKKQKASSFADWKWMSFSSRSSSISKAITSPWGRSKPGETNSGARRWTFSRCFNVAVFLGWNFCWLFGWLVRWSWFTAVSDCRCWGDLAKRVWNSDTHGFWRANEPSASVFGRQRWVVASSCLRRQGCCPQGPNMLRQGWTQQSPRMQKPWGFENNFTPRGLSLHQFLPIQSWLLGDVVSLLTFEHPEMNWGFFAWVFAGTRAYSGAP